jgi:hypothetical protein
MMVYRRAQQSDNAEEKQMKLMEVEPIGEAGENSVCFYNLLILS